MDRQILNFTVNEQTLIVENPIRISTNKVNYIEARFSLGQNWQGYDSVRAVWFNDYQTISTVLDSQGVCRVPFEVMKRKGNVKVNLVGSISENDVLTDRLTSYPVVAVIVDCIAQITGAETNPITPSQFEQYVAIVRDLVDSVKDIDYIELNDDYTLTIYYSDGTSYTTTSIRGEQGEVSQAQLDAVVSDLKSALTDETNARILLTGRMTTAEGDIDTLETHKVAQPLDEYNQPTDGTNGQSLRTKGDGTTEWADIGLPTDAQTAQAVSDWLDEHPEATTTVQDDSLTTAKYQDGSVTENKMSLSAKKKLATPSTVYGEYIGSYYDADNSICCCAKIENMMYTFEQKVSNLNYVTVRQFDMTANEFVQSYDIRGGHCNSVCVYDNKFYLLPLFEYDGQTPSSISEVRVFDTSFTLVDTIALPTNAMGISYDSVADALYYFDYQGAIYKFNNGAFELYTTTDFVNYAKASYNQDFAIHNGRFYISSPSGQVMYGDIEKTSCNIIGSMRIGRTDNYDRFILGELEGFEFYDGVLYITNYATVSSGSVSFVLKLDFNNVEALTVLYGVKVNETVYLSDAYKSIFKLNQGQLHVLQMVSLMREPFKYFRLKGDYTSKSDFLLNAVLMLDSHKLILESSLQILGYVTITGNGTIKTSSGTVFNCVNGMLKLNGTITVESDTLTTAVLIQVGSSKPIVACANALVTTMTLKIGSSTFTAPSFYFGETKVAP